MTIHAAPIPANPAEASLGSDHGYRFDGDLVHLNAEVRRAATLPASGQDWALQLWACSPSFSGARPDGVRVAELPLGSLDDASAVVGGTATALPPTVPGEHAMVLALVSGVGGRFATLHDLAIYPQTQIFLQPRLRGELGCRLAAGSVELSVEAIENPRPADNLSGTLALEVWSLDTPWDGGAWTGTPVASVVLGSLAGQCEWAACRFTAPAAMPAEPGHLVVMLCEWGPAGYLTRDCRTVATCAVVPAGAAVTAPAKPAKAKASKAAEPAARAPAKAAAPTSAVKGAAKPDLAPTRAAGVSVNRASEAELLALKGLSVAVARAIIAARPYAAIDDVCRAKGMGPKLLAKLATQLVL